MDSHRKAIRITLLLGLFLFPLLGILDLAVYPSFIKQLWIIRAFIILFLVVSLFVLKIIKDKYLFGLALFFFFSSSFAITLMCFVTGEGFSSPYYAGQFIVIIISTIFFPMKKNYYTAIVAICMIQHFGLLLFQPWQMKDLAITIFFLGAVIFSGWIVRKFVQYLLIEIKTLRGFLPICSNCKKIRDDKGYWKQIENYIRDHSEAEFTHSICPECAKNYMILMVNIKSGRADITFVIV